MHIQARLYLVTGGCGFIGSHLCDMLIGLGHDVVILDNLSTGKRENAPAQARIMIGDTTDYDTVLRAMKGMDGCFHLAAIASVEKSIVDWNGTHKVNLTSTINIFQAAKRRGRIPVVYTSSAAVYGDNLNVPLCEEDQPRPITAYGADKLGCDLHARIAWLVHGVPAVGLRPFNVYGPRQDPSSPYSGVISIFADRIAKGQPIAIYGDGEQVRDFVYVGDVARAFAVAMQQMEKSRLQNDIINLCTGRETSINQVASTLGSICGRKVERQYLDARKGDIRISIGNPARLASHLGLIFATPLERGLGFLMQEEREAA